MAKSAAVSILGLLSPLRRAAAQTGTGGAHDLRWPDLGSDWTDGLPLANGQLGAMVWMRGSAAVISLDRSDVWDLRPIPEFQEPGFTYAHLSTLRDAGNTAEIGRLFEAPFQTPGRGKLPLGRITLGLAGGDIRESALDLDQATASLELSDSTRLTVWIAAQDDVGVLHVKGPAAVRLALRARVTSPDFGLEPDLSRHKTSLLDYGGPEDLGYEPTSDLSGKGVSGYASGRASDCFAVLARSLVLSPNEAALVWTIATAPDRKLAAAKAHRLLRRLDANRLSLLRAHHEAWWRTFWSRTGVQTGEPELDRRWRLSTYHMGAAARGGAPPVPLQAPWTWDSGRLPAWKGDYHHDLNTQMTYWAAYTGNRPDISRNLTDWLWSTRGAAQEFAQRFFGVPGIAVPGTTDVLGRPLGGWAAYSFFPTASAWLLQHFDLHWRYFGDDAFLRERAYPYAQGVTQFLRGMLRPRAGREGLFLPANISPEINDNTLRSWFEEWTNFDLALVRYAFTTAARMADMLGRADDAHQHRATLSLLPAFSLDADGGFALAPGAPLAKSHRHFSHLIAFYPLRLLDPLTDPWAKRALDASLARLDRLGTQAWMGYSFAWLACLNAVAGHPREARQALAKYEQGFSGRNGFHTNGDRSGSKITGFPFSLFTLEGGQAACAAVQDMLLQSTSDQLRLFPALGDEHEASFRSLRGAPGLDVSASLRDGRVTTLSLKSTRPLEVQVSGPGMPKRTLIVQPGGERRFSVL
ncbi:glycosyl hydrolase family 95 catalytic domain-containing protein [Phenylobacterium sp.]|uniref:glycosyl hydrolase family 95 catalytic domain-containing protein n=1 Tax=Phenylobacterium sp. TaxID=1871053 RepID=UPI00374D874F